MAIPKLFSILVSQWPSLVRPAQQGEEKCDALFLDAGSFLHSCLNQATTEDEIIYYANTYINRIIDIAKPQRRAFIAFDGVPPIAKLKQQYLRGQEKEFDAPVIDRYSLKPGTLFMKRLTEEVKESLSKNMKEKKWPFELIISGPNVAGEGEQKIMSQLRELSNEKNEDLKNVVIYGLDADLIVMAMMIPNMEISIMRDTPQSRRLCIHTKSFLYFSITRLRAKIWLNYVNPTDDDMDKIMADVAMVITIFGNDFMPKPDGVELKWASLNKFLTHIKAVHIKNQYIVEDGDLNFEAWCAFLEEVEAGELLDFKSMHPPNVTNMASRMLELQLSQLSLSERRKTVKTFEKEVQRERYGEWKLKRYKTLYSHTDGLKEVCEDYTRGVQWLTKYYTSGVSSNWSYEHGFTPRLSDVLIHCEDLPGSAAAEDLDLKALHQLALVIPETSKILLPVIYRDSEELRAIHQRRSDGDFFQRDTLEKTIALLTQLDSDLGLEGGNWGLTKGSEASLSYSIGTEST